MKPWILVFAVIALVGCEGGDGLDTQISEDSEWSFIMEHMVTGSDPGVSVEFGSKTFFSDLTVLTSFDGPLEEMPEDGNNLQREYSPILFSNEEPQFRPGLGVRASRAGSDTRSRVSFFCSPYQEEPEMPLKRYTIYYYDTGKRGVVEIGEFAADDDRLAIEEKAREAIVRHVEAGDGESK